MNIIVNGEKKEFSTTSLTVEEILRQSKVNKPEQVSVQIDGAFVDPSTYSTRQVKDGNEVDFLYFLGGGRSW